MCLASNFEDSARDVVVVVVVGLDIVVAVMLELLTV